MDDVSDAEVTTTATSVSTTTAIAKPPPEPTKSLRELDGMKMAQLCHQSGLFKDIADMAKAAMKIKFGYALGIDEATAMSSIIIVQGRMSFTANFIAARIRQSGKYRYVVKEKSDKKCKLQFFEKVDQWQDGKLIFTWEKPGPEEEFTIEMAKRADLVKPGSAWTKFPEAMLFARCLTAGARTYCSDVFLGNAPYTPDELDQSLSVNVNEQGEIVEDAPKVTAAAVKKKAVAAKPPPAAETKEDVINRIQTLAAELGADTKPYAKFYGVDDMRKLTMEQLSDFERKLTQKKASS